MEQERLILAARTLADNPDRDVAAKRLIDAGFSKSEAVILVDVIPEAFAVPVLRDLGVSSISNRASAKTKHGRWVDVNLDDIPIFVHSLKLAQEHRNVGVMSNDTYKRVAESSALIDAANKALNSGDSLNGATVSIAFNGAIAESLGYRPWYSRILRRSAT